MTSELINRYIWIVDTIRRFGSITSRQLNSQWAKSSFSQGEPLPRRTFYNYRAAIEELFNINIVYNSSDHTYSIEELDRHDSDMTDWMLNSAAMTNLLADSREVSDMIFFEDVPSAREFLGTVTQALKERHPVRFDYLPFTRLTAKNVTVEPYFLKIFKQRWYLTGMNTKDKVIKTYALDRISNLVLTSDSYEIPADFDAEEYFRDSFGIVFNQGEVKDITLKVDSQQAKYFRALPLHHSQSESFADGYSLFHYRMRITYDFVEELLSHGPKVIVLNPPELRAIIIDSLRQTLSAYTD